jgi:hypothetical protein
MGVQHFERLAQSDAQIALASERHGGAVIIARAMHEWALNLHVLPNWTDMSLLDDPLRDRQFEINTQRREPVALDRLLNDLKTRFVRNFFGVDVHSHNILPLRSNNSL